MLIILLIIAVLILSVFAFMQQPKFGKTPSGEQLEKIKRSPNYRDGQFQNVHHTPVKTEGTSYFKMLKQFFFEKDKRVIPADEIPAVKTNLHTLDAAKDVLVWLGHSSYFMQVNGRKILVDPVFGNSVSPLPGSMKAFPSAFPYTADDMP
ncbi:MAG: MBL fold metallo-hydrolase, partial [Chitinophagaceae bacterium]